MLINKIINLKELLNILKLRLEDVKKLVNKRIQEINKILVNSTQNLFNL